MRADYHAVRREISSVDSLRARRSYAHRRWNRASTSIPTSSAARIWRVPARFRPRSFFWSRCGSGIANSARAASSISHAATRRTAACWPVTDSMWSASIARPRCSRRARAKAERESSLLPSADRKVQAARAPLRRRDLHVRNISGDRRERRPAFASQIRRPRAQARRAVLHRHRSAGHDSLRLAAHDVARTNRARRGMCR